MEGPEGRATAPQGRQAPAEEGQEGVAQELQTGEGAQAAQVVSGTLSTVQAEEEEAEVVQVRPIMMAEREDYTGVGEVPGVRMVLIIPVGQARRGLSLSPISQRCRKRVASYACSGVFVCWAEYFYYDRACDKDTYCDRICDCGRRGRVLFLAFKCTAATR